jgi:hypothetical protein
VEVLSGQIIDDPSEAVDDAIDEWHESDTELSLVEWLGMTETEYAFFFVNQDNLGVILHARALESMMTVETSGLE